MSNDKILKIDVYSMSKFIEVNASTMVEVKDPIYTDRNKIPTPTGLFSYEMFGTSPRDRKEIWGYIDLKGIYIHPKIHKTLKRVIPKLIDGIISGTIYVNTDPNGELYEDYEGGWTGLTELYNNWDKIKIKPTGSTERDIKLRILNSKPKDTIFIRQFVVIPPFYRDMKIKGSTIAVDQVNEYYSNILKKVRMIESEANTGFSFTLYRTQFQVQESITSIYNFYTKEPNLSKKRGIIRRSLMGKSVDYAARLVISAPRYNLENFKDDAEVSFLKVGVPLATLCSIFYPFIHKWVSDWFSHHLMTDKTIVGGDGKLYHPKNVESQFDSKYIEKIIKNFIKSPASRFDKISLETEEGVVRDIIFAGVYKDSGKIEGLSSISHRPMTVCDLLYMAAVDVTKDKHIIVTRYPLTDYTGIYPAKIHVLSTINTAPAYMSNEVYRHYPVIDPNLSFEKISVIFVDTLVMSNVYLKALGADYDGDQITVRGVFTQEANLECSKHIYSKKNILNVSGSSIRTTDRETMQTLYNLTKGVANL